MPENDIMGSFVQSDDGMRADGFATLLCVCPLSLSQSILSQEKDYTGAIIDTQGNLYTSPHCGMDFFR